MREGTRQLEIENASNSFHQLDMFRIILRMHAEAEGALSIFVLSLLSRTPFPPQKLSRTGLLTAKKKLKKY